MFSYNRLIATFVVACWMVTAALAQTTTANLKTPGAASDTKATDIKTAAVPNSADPAKLPQIVPSEYIVGEADVLNVNVWKEPEVSQTVVVRTDGNISLPLINEVKVSGLTPVQIQEAIAARLEKFFNHPQVTVTVTDIRSKRAFITGEVSRPGGYSLNAQTTVLQLIAQAGGFTPFAKRDSIIVLRNEAGKLQKLKFKYKEVVQGKNTEQNISLHPGDTVVVP